MIKANKKNLLIYILLIGGGSTILACNPDNSGNIRTEIDSTELREQNQRLRDYRSGLNKELNNRNQNDTVHSNNAIRVELDKDKIDWVTLREYLKQTGGNQYEGQNETLPLEREERAIGQWQSSGEYEYRTVFRTFNDRLWVQTHMKTSNEADDETRGTTVLSRNAADSLKLNQLWAEMEEMAIQITDNFKSQ